LYLWGLFLKSQGGNEGEKGWERGGRKKRAWKEMGEGQEIEFPNYSILL